MNFSAESTWRASDLVEPSPGSLGGVARTTVGRTISSPVGGLREARSRRSGVTSARGRPSESRRPQGAPERREEAEPGRVSSSAVTERSAGNVSAPVVLSSTPYESPAASTVAMKRDSARVRRAFSTSAISSSRGSGVAPPTAS